jgi:hypothetical protein
MKRIWQLSLQLYPKDYRLLFGEEILAILEHKAADQCTNNPFASLAFNAAEILGLIRGAAVEWTSKIRQGAGYLDRSHREVAAPADAPLDEVTATRSRIEWNLRRMEHAIAHHDFEGARLCSRQDLREREKLRRLLQGQSPHG